MFEERYVDVDKFIAESTQSGLTTLWAIRYDPARPDHILYYPHVNNPQRCPYVPILKSRIRRIEPLFSVQCYDAHGPLPIPRQAWIARVTLVPMETDADAELLGALNALAEISESAGKTSGGSCESCSQPDDLQLLSESVETTYAATCGYGCRNGQSITTTGYGSTPAAARTNAENRASIYCATRGGITSYGSCAIRP